jgi:hypothetical protein
MFLQRPRRSVQIRTQNRDARIRKALGFFGHAFHAGTNRGQAIWLRKTGTPSAWAWFPGDGTSGALKPVFHHRRVTIITANLMAAPDRS